MALLQRHTSFHLSRLLFGSPSTYTTTRPPLPLLTSITLPSISIGLSGILSEIWEGILRAVPKKKTSHMKRRHRQLAGKALKDVKAICSCPGCGRPKKTHFLCPYCVAGKQEAVVKMKVCSLVCRNQTKLHGQETRWPVVRINHSRKGMKDELMNS